MSPVLQNWSKLILKDSKVMCLSVLVPFQPSLILFIKAKCYLHGVPFRTPSLAANIIHTKMEVAGIDRDTFYNTVELFSKTKMFILHAHDFFYSLTQ